MVVRGILMIGVFISGLYGFIVGSEEVAQPFSHTALVGQIYETPEFLPLIDIDQAKITLQDLATSLQRMQTDYAQVDERRSYIEERFGRMMQSIEKTIDATETNKKLINDTLTKIALLESNISRLRDEILVLKVDLATAREQVVSYLLFLYQSYQGLYGTTDTFSVWKQFLGGRVIDVGLTAQQFAEMLTNALERQLQEIKTRQTQYIQKSHDLNTAKITYHQAAKGLQRDIARLDEQRQFLYAQVRALQTDKATLDQQASSLSRTQEQIAADLERVKKMTLEGQGTTSVQVASLLELPDKSVGRNYLTWPLLPPGRAVVDYGELISDPFSEERVLADFVRFEIPQGEYVYASAHGLVHSVVDGGFDMPSSIVLLHKEGIITTYTPLEDIFVVPGDIVRRGEVIATSGGQPGTKGAGPQSALPHLDFRVFKNAQHTHPYQYLDLSVFADGSVPEERVQKQRDDLFAREVPLENLPTVVGSTVAERRDNFLRRYASGPYGSSALRYDAAQGLGINPIVGMCIGFSETSFRNFKSENNIGNVGNNDRGDVVEYASPVAGARALYHVLNNQYLGGYHTINELSRFGNSDGFIYASSPYNRQRNVMRCLSSIYGYRIPEDFPFRILKD